MANPIDIAPFYSERSKSWLPSGIRGLFPLELRPNMISFLAGKPNPSTFPFSSLTLRLKSSHTSSLSVSSDNANGQAEEEQEITIDGKELEEALQYGATSGLPALVRWLEDFQAQVHQRKKEDGRWRVSVGVGSQDCLFKAFQALVNPGDAVLMETPAYSGTLGAIRPTSPDFVEVQTDSDGLDPTALESILSNWQRDYPGKASPKLLYTIPMGSNPTGASIPEGRKREILKLAKKYNFLILEDDAYAFVYYGTTAKARSYFSLEPEVNDGETGRVIRFDSFSKILSSGMRLGFITAQKEFLDKIDLLTANSHLQTPSTTQAITYALLKQWGPEGLLAHCEKVSDFYRQKRDMFEAAAQKHLRGVATWTSPVAGMFLFIHMQLHIDGREGDSFAVILEKAVEKGVLAVPGMSFMPSGSKSACVRTSFSLATEEQAEEGFKRLRAVIDDARAER